MHSENMSWFVFVLGFLGVALLETLIPLRSLPSSTPRRWTSNLVLYACTAAALALALQIGTLAFAFTAAPRGLLSRVPFPYGVRFVLGLVLVDLTIYLSHRLFHAFPWLWRIHQVHHAETDLDLTTGFRFHPVEALLNQGTMLIAIALLGPPPSAVALMQLVIVVQNYLQHANLRFPESLDRLLRTVIVTPAMHRVHHAEAVPLQNTNFSTVFSVWDRLFGTYLPMPSSAHAHCGLAELPHGSELNAVQLLLLPFRRPLDHYSVAESLSDGSPMPIRHFSSRLP